MVSKSRKGREDAGTKVTKTAYELAVEHVMEACKHSFRLGRFYMSTPGGTCLNVSHAEAESLVRPLAELAARKVMEDCRKESGMHGEDCSSAPMWAVKRGGDAE